MNTPIPKELLLIVGKYLEPLCIELYDHTIVKNGHPDKNVLRSYEYLAKVCGCDIWFFNNARYTFIREWDEFDTPLGEPGYQIFNNDPDVDVKEYERKYLARRRSQQTQSTSWCSIL